MKHELKIDEPFLEAKLAGDKLFEIRLNDRGYQKGHFTEYVEYGEIDKSGINHSRLIIKHVFEITYVSNYMQKENYVVFGEKYIGTED